MVMFLLCAHHFFITWAEESNNKSIDYFSIDKNREERVDDQYEQFKKDSAVIDSLKTWESEAGPWAQARAYYNIGNMLFEEKRYKEAVRYYQKAIEFDSKEKDVYYQLGVIYDRFLKNNAKAVEYFTKYVELSPDAKDVPYVKDRIISLRMGDKARRQTTTSPLVGKESSDEEEVVFLLKTIKNFASESNVKIIDITPRKTKNESEMTKKYIVDLNCEAPVKKMIVFMHKVENSHALLRVERFSVISKSKGSEISRFSLTISKIGVL